MAVEFKHDITVNVPICCLIEDYQTLLGAKQNGDWDEVGTVMECLAETIRMYGEPVPKGLKFNPTENTLIAMSAESGILCNEDGSDIQCANGHDISDAGGVQCDTCPHYHKDCDAEAGRLMLHGGYVYDMSEYSSKDEKLLDILKGEEK